jgi:hypothetical protein
VNIEFPFRFDGRGRTAIADDEAHIRGLIEQVLFTNPGERVNRPDFGTGLLQVVFAGNGLVLGALQQWLGDVIEVRNLQFTSEEAALRVELQYVVRRTQTLRAAVFERSFAP